MYIFFWSVLNTNSQTESESMTTMCTTVQHFFKKVQTCMNSCPSCRWMFSGTYSGHVVRFPFHFSLPTKVISKLFQYKILKNRKKFPHIPNLEFIYMVDVFDIFGKLRRLETRMLLRCSPSWVLRRIFLGREVMKTQWNKKVVGLKKNAFTWKTLSKRFFVVRALPFFRMGNIFFIETLLNLCKKYFIKIQSSTAIFPKIGIRSYSNGRR